MGALRGVLCLLLAVSLGAVVEWPGLNSILLDARPSLFVRPAKSSFVVCRVGVCVQWHRTCLPKPLQ